VALDQSALLEVLDALKAAEVDDRIRQAAQTIYQALIEAELTSVIGAAPHERTPERLAQRNGHRSRRWSALCASSTGVSPGRNFRAVAWIAAVAACCRDRSCSEPSSHSPIRFRPASATCSTSHGGVPLMVEKRADAGSR
jgi:mutator family transposase